MKLYYARTPHGRKVCAVAAYLGVDLDYELVDLANGAHRQPGYLAINPMGQVPALWDGSGYLCESNAIAVRLALEAGNDLWPADHRQAAVLRWLSWDSEHFKPIVATYFVENVLRPFVGAQPDQEALGRAEEALPRIGSILDRALESSDFVVGASPTVADFALATFMPFARQSGLSLAAFPAVVRWHERMSSLPRYLDPYPAES